MQGCGPELRKSVKGEQTEFYGSKEVMQGRQKVDGHYFAGLIPKAKDLRLYFFPIYTHPQKFPELSPELRKTLKGKSCFHLKNLSDESIEELKSMIAIGYGAYKEAGLI